VCARTIPITILEIERLPAAHFVVGGYVALGNCSDDIVMDDRSFRRLGNASSEAVIARLSLL
jgi:hypothetical protein